MSLNNLSLSDQEIRGLIKLILVTGATGFIGSHTTRAFVKRGYNIKVTARASSSLANIVDIVEQIEVVECNLVDEKDVAKAIRGVEAIIHIAGCVSTHPKDRENVYASNYIATRNVLKAAWNEGVGRFIYVGSIFALGKGTEFMPADEDVRYNLEHLRGKIHYFDAKRLAELEVDNYEEQGLPIVRIYPNFCLGPGDIHLSSSKFLVAQLNGLLPFYIGGGINVQDVRDAAEGIFLGYEVGRTGQKYIIGGRNMSFSEFFMDVERITGAPAPKIRIPKALAYIFASVMHRFTSLIDPASILIMGDYWYYDDRKARAELGYTSRYLGETIRDAVRWFLKRGIVKRGRIPS